MPLITRRWKMVGTCYIPKCTSDRNSEQMQRWVHVEQPLLCTKMLKTPDHELLVQNNTVLFHSETCCVSDCVFFVIKSQSLWFVNQSISCILFCFAFWFCKMILFTCVSMAVYHFESMNRKCYIMVIMNSLESSISGEMNCYGLLYTVLIFHRGRDGGYV